MKPSQNTSRHGKPFMEYRCKAGRRENAAPCPEPASVSASLIERYVVERFFAGLGDYSARAVADTDALALASDALVEAEIELDAALDTRLAKILDDDRRMALVRNRQGVVERCRQELADARTAQPPPDVRLLATWPDLSLQERRHLLGSVLDAVFVRRGTDVGERTFLCWRGEGPELPVRGRRWRPRRFDFPA